MKFFIILSVILFAILPVGSIIFEENDLPTVNNIIKFDDDTIVVHIIHVTNITEKYVEFKQELSFRAIYPNGTINAVDISMEKLDIQPINFRLFIFTIIYRPMEIYAVKSNILLLTYVETDNADDFSTYQKHAILVDLSGNIQASRLGISFFIVKFSWVLPS
jgi:hypothetical protein